MSDYETFMAEDARLVILRELARMRLSCKKCWKHSVTKDRVNGSAHRCVNLTSWARFQF